MATFILLGKYSHEALKEISATRTSQANELIKKLGGEVVAMYTLLGERDLLFILNFPGIEQAMQASIGLTNLLDISFTTIPAITVRESDKLLGK
jgi:uncharacterized protein with GYD domain